MKTMTAITRTFTACAAAALASMALASTAFAATVHGADFHGTGSALESGEIDVLNVDGSAGETVFLAVSKDGRKIAQNLPYTIGADAAADDEATWAGVATLDIANLDLNSLDGSYVIDAFATRAGGETLYTGSIYGVYADLPDGSSKLIGTRTANASEAEGRSFVPSATIYDAGRTYKLAGEAQGSGALHFAYEEYDEATTVDGVINYTDAAGSVVASSVIPGIGYGEEVEVDIPDVVVADNGDLYRTVYFRDAVTAKNPGAVSFSVYCIKMSEADQALSGFYVATIKMVDENGALIASDTVNVTGNFVYTAPSVIYKKEAQTSIGQPAVVTYRVDGSPTIYLSAANDNVMNHVRTIEIAYVTQEPDQPSVDVNYSLIDGSKRVGEEGRSLGTQQVTVDLQTPTATPDASIEANGVAYNLVGEPDDYAYTIRSGEVPSINAYYVPEGYVAPGPYEVTVNYVNFATDKVIESQTYTSDPNDTANLSIETPATFSAEGIDYVRLDGQEAAIQHSYYSGIATYTVYYRDKNDELTSGTVINTIRVVYADEPAAEGDGQEAGDNGTAGVANQGAGAAGTGATGAGGTAGANAGANAAADGQANATADNTAQNLQLNDGRTYNVFDGDNANGTLTNESGVDSNAERIEDSETPLASGFDRGGTSTAASSLSSFASLALPVGVGLLVVVAAAGGFMLFRRRSDEDGFVA